MLVFAPGPSLITLWRGRKSPLTKICVGDAWCDLRPKSKYSVIVPDADLVYHTDHRWWSHHKGLPGFSGVRVGYEGPGPAGIIWVQGAGTTGYDHRLGWVCHGMSSGYVAVHLAAQLGARRIVLIGFDMRPVGGKEHYFGEHPREIRKTMPFDRWVPNFGQLERILTAMDVQVLNATPDSALTCFPFVALDDV